MAVTGVSGSGKSSLIFDILDLAARQHFNGATGMPGKHDSITGWEHIDKVITIDQAAYRAYPALECCHLFRLIHTHPRSICSHTGSQKEWNIGAPLFIQRAGRAL